MIVSGLNPTQIAISVLIRVIIVTGNIRFRIHTHHGVVCIRIISVDLPLGVWIYSSALIPASVYGVNGLERQVIQFVIRCAWGS